VNQHTYTGDTVTTGLNPLTPAVTIRVQL